MTQSGILQGRNAYLSPKLMQDCLVVLQLVMIWCQAAEDPKQRPPCCLPRGNLDVCLYCLRTEWDGEWVSVWVSG